jgi:hypothetical protein
MLDGLEDGGHHEVGHEADHAGHEADDEGLDEAARVSIFLLSSRSKRSAARERAAGMSPVCSPTLTMSMSSGGNCPLRSSARERLDAFADVAHDGFELALEVRILDGLMRELHRMHHGEAVAEQVGHRFEELDVEPGLEDGAEERQAQFEARPRNGGLRTCEPGA